MVEQSSDELPGRWQGGDWYVEVRLQPRAARVTVLGMYGTAIKIAVTAPPVAGAANQALCHWLAEQLHIAKGRVQLLAGEQARDKRLRLQAVTEAEVRVFCQRWQLSVSGMGAQADK
ncbi:DUF167 domain-containing protein [Candidatus Magnetaquicoccus inordinatus]|uniref:DUF167 domain-containing protein n=1 Tax=Candidatus Magnetaquicoccus inordinatus TaxID=2496818 RepID=UPI00102B5405|nr:DUF167 family protein [Candidatus Magnetaquicoccus inordinatus]